MGESWRLHGGVPAMRVVVRADSSHQIGSGHIMRCLALADRLRQMDAEVFFLCRDLAGNLSGIITDSGYEVKMLSCEKGRKGGMASSMVACSTMDWQSDLQQSRQALQEQGGVNWLIVDHYALDWRWESQMRPYASKIMAIDDLANRGHDCDLLLDQNYYDRMEQRYDNLVPVGCRSLLGPRYVLFRPEFYETRASLRERTGDVQRVLLFFGGSDTTNETAKALKSLRLIGRTDWTVDVVLGVSNPFRNEVKSLCSGMPNVSFYLQVSNMAELIARADLAIGAGGTATWERCFLALPTVTIVTADNQDETTLAMAQRGAVHYAGRAEDVSVNSLAAIVREIVFAPTVLKNMGLAAAAVMEGHRTDWVSEVFVRQLA